MFYALRATHFYDTVLFLVGAQNTFVGIFVPVALSSSGQWFEQASLEETYLLLLLFACIARFEAHHLAISLAKGPDRVRFCELNLARVAALRLVLGHLSW